MNDLYRKIIDDLNIIDNENEDKILVDYFDRDLLTYFYVLAGADKKFSDLELDFINENFQKNVKKDDFQNRINYGVKKKKYSYSIPFCFAKLNNYVNKDNCRTIIEIYDLSFELYKSLGIDFLACDNKATEKEIEWYSSYLTSFKTDVRYYKDLAFEFIDEEELNYVEPIVEENPLEDALEELNSLIGLENVKKEIDTLINIIKVRTLREQRGFVNPVMSFHMVFSGNPGTGKTTVARILAKIFKGLGLLSKGELVETDRAGLVAGYVGQTAEKTLEVCQNALGGVLFIDEAYALNNSSSNDYGQEAINTLLKYMEDNRNDLIVIVAGYTELMNDFVESNPGLKSRFNKYINFKDYGNEELLSILDMMAEKNNYIISKEAKEEMLAVLKSMKGEERMDFGNARGIRNLFEKSISNQANRIADITDISDEDLQMIIDKDISK